MDMIEFLSVWGIANEPFIIGRQIKSFFTIQIGGVQISLYRIIRGGDLTGPRIISKNAVPVGDK